MSAQEAVILGTSGPAGSHLAAALNRRSIQDRASQRDLETLGKSFIVAPKEPPEVHAMDPDALARTIEGYDLVYDCLTSAHDDSSKLPLMARSLALAAAKAGVRVIHISNYWSYLPVSYLPLDEDHPRTGGGDRAKYRREAEDVILAGGGAVVHLPDFYGPLVYAGAVQKAIAGAAQGKNVSWVGSPTIQREYAFIPDAMEAVVRLSYYREAFGQRWIVGGNGPLGATGLAEILSKKLNRKVSVSSAGALGLRVKALYDDKARALLQLLPDLSSPIRFDSSKLESVIGPVPTLSHEQAVARTLEWLERRRLVK